MLTHSRMGAFDERPHVPRADARASRFDRTRFAGFRSGYPAADDRPVAGARNQRHRRHRAAAAGAAGAGRAVPDQTEIIITATKREENLQNVPISVQAIGTRRLDQLNISNFEDYTKQLPSVTFLTPSRASRPSTCAAFAARNNAEGNHSGPAAAGRHLSRRAAGDDDRRNARRPHLRHRPDREPRRAAGHALRRLERSGHDPHHHQQARARRDDRPNRRRDQHGRSWRHGRQARGHDQPADRTAHRVPRQSPSTSTTPASSTISSAADLLRRHRSTIDGR